MRKILVKTTGDFMLFTRFGFIEAFRPSIVTHCTEIDQFVSQDQIKVLPVELPDNADDAEFEKFYIAHDKDEETAIENYKLNLDGVEETPDEGADKAPDEGEDDAEKPATKTTTKKATTAKK